MLKFYKQFLNIASIYIILLGFLHCKSANNINSSNKNTLKGIANKVILSKEKIDKEDTYEVYFTIKNREMCIKIGMSSKIYDSITRNGKIVKTFFIVEKVVDISQFNDRRGEKIVFSELGRNFDHNWEREKDITICSSKVDPIKRLDKNIYRIRFTTFMKKEFNFEVSLFSKNKIDFYKEFPTIQ